MVRGNNRAAVHEANWHDKIKIFLGSKLFFRAVLVIFAVQASYIAIRNGFPMAFDESYHLGIIQLHAQQWSPFLSHLSNSSGQYGALATDPSYLYHYILSFPYRFIELFTQNLHVVVVLLRLINVAFFVAGMALFRKVLAFTGASKALVNLTILGFALIPIESFTAAQINYDNLVFPVTALALLLCLQFAEKLRADEFDVRRLLSLSIVCFLGAQVKYVFWPIFAAIVVFTSFMVIRWAQKNRQAGLRAARANFLAISRRARFALLGVLVLSAGMFSWRIGYNEVKYGSLNPGCAQVLSVKSCMQYAVWARGYELAQTHVPVHNLAQKEEFAKIWTHITGNELFTVISTQGGKMVAPVRQLVIGAKLIALGGVVLLLFQWRRIRNIGYPAALFMLVSLTYLGALIAKNYGDYTQDGIPIAIQGRYLLPVLLILMIFLAQAYSFTLHNTPRLKVAALACALLIVVQGGGIVTYVMRTNSSWRWNAATAAISQPTVTTQVASKT